MNQKEIEKLNQEIKERVKDSDILEYYRTHTTKETLKKYDIRNKSQLLKILKSMNYDFSIKKKDVMRGRASARSHESYINGGKKSSETQKKSWNNKSQEEKDSWRQHQIETHNTEEYKQLMSNISKEAYERISLEDRERMNLARSETMKEWWNSLTPEQKDEEIRKHLDGGAGWNHETIKKTVHERYGVDNVAMLDSVKEIVIKNMVETCREKYGVDYNCQLPQCMSAIGSKASDTIPNLEFDALLKQYNVPDYVDIKGKDGGREFPLEKYTYDFRVGKYLIEINPSASHNSNWGVRPQSKPKPKFYHKDKSDTAKKHGYQCIHIWDWDDKEKIIRLLLKRETIYARKCEVRHVSKQEGKEFLNKYHLQNYARCSVLLGLYYNNELVSIMTFGKPRFNSKYDYEIIRYCSSIGVIGGAERLLKHFIDEYKPHTIVSYCDNSKFNGDTYIKLGFELIKSGYPSKHWYNLKTKEHYTDSLIRQQGFSRIIHHCDASEDNLDTDDNRALMLSAEFVEVYDSGQSTYLLEINY